MTSGECNRGVARYLTPMDDASIVLSVARGYIKSFGKAAPRKLRQFACEADDRGDMLAAETWRDLADAAQLILSRPA